MGRISEEGRRVAELVEGWRERTAEVDTPEKLNALFAEARESSEGPARHQVKAVLVQHAAEHGWSWDKDEGGFVMPQQEDAQGQQGEAS